MIPAARFLRVVTTTTDVALLNGAAVLYGWAFEETTGAAGAQIELYDGSSTTGDGPVPISLLANESTRDIWGAPGIGFEHGIFLHVVSGSVKGTLFASPGNLVDGFLVAQGAKELWAGEL